MNVFHFFSGDVVAVEDVAVDVVILRGMCFGIDITVICDKVRSDREPKPIALYQVTKVDRLQKGVIVAAKVDNIEKLDDTVKCSRKHEEYRWISEQEIDSFHEETVEDFKDTLKKIFLMWDELFSEE